MISLHVYLTPKPGKDRELEAAITDEWLAAMAEQPGFVRAALLRPSPAEELAKLGAARPAHAFEVVAFWRSEQERLAWVARPVHDRVFKPVVALAASVSFTVQTVARGWKV
jgi:heme-degrading monooxygenase HmoA